MINLVALALAASHSAVPAPAPPTAMTSMDPNGGYVVVDNKRGVALTVYAETDMGEVELGTVAAHAAEALPMEAQVVSQHEVNFLVDPSGQCLGKSGFVEVSPRETIRLIVPPRWGPGDHDKYDPGLGR